MERKENRCIATSELTIAARRSLGEVEQEVKKLRVNKEMPLTARAKDNYSFIQWLISLPTISDYLRGTNRAITIFRPLPIIQRHGLFISPIGLLFREEPIPRPSPLTSYRYEFSPYTIHDIESVSPAMRSLTKRVANLNKLDIVRKLVRAVK